MRREPTADGLPMYGVVAARTADVGRVWVLAPGWIGNG